MNMAGGISIMAHWIGIIQEWPRMNTAGGISITEQ